MLERRIKPTKVYGMCMEGKGHCFRWSEQGKPLWGSDISRFLQKKNETHAPFAATYTGEPMYQHLFHAIIIQYFTHIVELGSLLFHFIYFSPLFETTTSSILMPFWQLIFSVLSLFLFILLQWACFVLFVFPDFIYFWLFSHSKVTIFYKMRKYLHILIHTYAHICMLSLSLHTSKC